MEMYVQLQWQLAGISNHNLALSLARPSSLALDLVHNVHSLDDLSENNMLAI